MAIIGPINSGATTGGAGVSTANADTTSVVGGLIYAVYVKYNGSPPATTDVVIKTKGTSPRAPSLTFLTLTDKNTDGWFYPRLLADDNLGVDISGEYILPYVEDLINVSIAQANDADSVDVWIMLI